MLLKAVTKKYPKIFLVALSAMLFAGLLFVVRGVAMSRAASPLVATQKVRNLSAQETDWQTATAAVPGDVLEYFALVQLPTSHASAIKDIILAASLDENFSYRDQTLSSFASRSVCSTWTLAEPRLSSKS